MMCVRLTSVAFGGDALTLPVRRTDFNMHDPSVRSTAKSHNVEEVHLVSLKQRNDDVIRFGDLVTISRPNGLLLTAYTRPTRVEPRDIPYLPANPQIAGRATSDTEPCAAWVSGAAVVSDQTTFAWRILPAVTQAAITAWNGRPVEIGDAISLQFQLAPRVWAYLNTETHTLVANPLAHSLDSFVMEVSDLEDFEMHVEKKEVTDV